VNGTVKKNKGVFILDIYYRRESGVSQASRRVAQKIERDKKLKKKIVSGTFVQKLLYGV